MYYVRVFYMEIKDCCSSLEHSQTCQAICKVGPSASTHEETREHRN
jgi:hypothetical protein